MGLLSEGRPLSWEETKKYANHVREHGIIQFINLYNREKDKKGDILKFGDEVEYVVIKFDHANEIARLSLCADRVLPMLNLKEAEDPEMRSSWKPEYSAYMIEGTPGKPYGGMLAHFNLIEANMKFRREQAQELLEPDEIILTVTTFPRIGCPNFTWPLLKPTPTEGATHSLFYPDEAVYLGHPRFLTITRNIRMRRGEKVIINIPIFKDTNTPSPFKEDLYALGDTGESTNAALPDHVYMDAMGFGMGASCLQVTFQACCIEEGRVLYDQLAGLSPIMLAVTASTPVLRGYLTEADCRWSVISQSVDCRTREEKGLEPLKNNKFRIPKSRYDSIDSYLSPYGEHLNDVAVLYDEAIYNKLIKAGIDHLLAQHVAHLFIRDTLSVFEEKLFQDDETDTDHFENIQSTNWQTMRFKPPPPNSDIGWRVEFRPCEVQSTDFENAAFVAFITLLTRVILSYKLNLVLPISKVEENMGNATKQDAISKETYWFRKNINLSRDLSACCNVEVEEDCSPSSLPICMKMTINEIFNGKKGEFVGLIPLLRTYLSSMEVDADTHCTITRYLDFMQAKTNGELPTTASWIRKFITTHPAYKFDSVVNEKINYDLMKTICDMQNCKIKCLDLLGRFAKANSKSSDTIAAAEGKIYSCEE